MQNEDAVCFINIDAADAGDGHRSMWLKSSADKVIEANRHYMLRLRLWF